MITDDQLDELLAAADPAPAHRIAALPLGPARDALRGAIAAEADGSAPCAACAAAGPARGAAACSSRASPAPRCSPSAARRCGSRSAATTAAPGRPPSAPSPIARRGSSRPSRAGPSSAPASGTRRPARSSSRTATSACSSPGTAGQPDAASKDPQVGTVEVGDATATITGDGEPPATARRFFATFRSGDWLVVADGSAMALDRYREVVGGLRHADVDAWLDAMPPTIVRPAGRASAVAAMLEGVPLPDGFDVEALRRSEGLVLGRYDLGARVSGAVACAWIERWAAAKARGDELAARRASTALGTSHGWPILQEMDAAGDYPEVLWQLADAVAGPGTVEGGKTVAVQDAYVEALGCDAG